MVVGVVSMVLMGVVEVMRKYDLSVHGGIEQNVGGVKYNASHVSLLWQIPQFLTAGVAESFTLVSGTVSQLRSLLKPGFHSNAIACVCCVKFASACVSCGFRLCNARNASDCV